MVSALNFARLGRLALALLLGLFCLAFYLPLSSKAVNNIFYIGLAVPMLLWLLARPRALVELRPFAWLFGLLALMVALDASDPADLKKTLYLVLFFVACLFLSARYWALHAPLLLFALCSLGLLLFVLADWLWIWTHSGQWIRYERFLGESLNPVYFSLLLGFALLYLWMFHIAERLQQRSTWLMLLGLFVLSVLLVLCASIFQSRSTLLGYAVFFVGFLLYRRLFWLGLGLGLGLLLLAVLSGVDDLLVQRGLSYRLDIWQAALQRWLGECSLWWGCGKDGVLLLGQFHHPHSGYLAMLYRNGLLGALLFLIFALLYLRYARSPGVPWLLLSLFGWGSLLTTTNGVLTSPQPLWIYFWLPTFMAIIAGQALAVQRYLQRRDQALRS